MESEICGNELNFLTYRLSIRGNFTDKLLKSENFYNHFTKLKRQGIRIDDAIVYEELKKMLFPIADEESRYLHEEDFRAQYVENYGEEAYKTMRRDYHSFKRALSQLSKVLYGDTAHWKEDYEAEYSKPYIEPVIKSRAEIPEENKDLTYLIEVCDKLKPTSLEKLLTEELTVKAFRKAGKITDIYYAYEVFKPVFFRCVRLGYKNKEEKRRTYYRLRSIAEDFCNVLYSDKLHWREDYAAWAAENEVL